MKQNSELNDIFGILGQTFFKMQFETEKLAEPSTAARGMSFVMQSAILEAVTTRLVNQNTPRDKQGHCGCAHQHKALVEGWMCRSTQHTSDWLLDVMDGNRSQNAPDSKGLSSFGYILEMLEPSLWPGRHMPRTRPPPARGSHSEGCPTRRTNLS